MSEIHLDNVAAVNEAMAVASEQALGFPPVLIGGIKRDAIVSEMTYDEVFAVGGIAETGGFTAIVRASDFPAGPPARFTPIEARGMQLEVMSVQRGVGHYLLTAANPTNE